MVVPGPLLAPASRPTVAACGDAVGFEGEAPADPLHGGTDVWFSVCEVPDYSILVATPVGRPTAG